MKKAYDDMKSLLKKSMDECVRLSEEVVRLESVARGSRAEVAEAREAARAAKASSAEAVARAEAAEGREAAAKKALEEERHQHARVGASCLMCGISVAVGLGRVAVTKRDLQPHQCGWQQYDESLCAGVGECMRRRGHGRVAPCCCPCHIDIENVTFCPGPARHSITASPITCLEHRIDHSAG